MTTSALRASAVVVLLGLAAACSSGGPGPSASTPDPTTPATTTPAASSPSVSTPTSAAPSSVSSTGAQTVPTAHVVPAPSTPLRTVTAVSPSGVTHVVRVWADRTDTSCYDHAHGQPIVTFLTTHPCRGLRRELATTTLDGRDVGLSIMSTGFTGTAQDPYATTAQFRDLVERDGTGSLDDLLRDGYRLPAGPTSLPSPDAFACLGQDNGVTIYDLWFLDGPTPDNDKGLETLAQDIFLQV